jgi:hypothetical protein
MPRSRPLTGYPLAAFRALFTQARRAPVTIPLERVKALTLRGELYAFRRAAQADPHEAARWGLVVDDMLQVALRVVPDGLEVYPLETSNAAIAIMAALGAGPLPKAEPKPSEAQEAADSLARLRALTGGGDADKV